MVHKRYRFLLILFVVILFGALIFYNFFRTWMMQRYFANYTPPPVSVSAVKAQKKDWTPYLESVGNFTAIQGVEVNSQAAGNVVNIHFDSGQYLEKGSPLIDLDDAVEQATLKFNQAELVLRKINYERQSNLLKRNATPTSSVDAARASLAEGEADVEKTMALIQQKHITAPFSGKVGIRLVNLGQYITPGQTGLVALQSLDPLFFNFYLPEQMSHRIHLNQAITFRVDAFPNFIFEGQLTAINSKIDTNTHNLLIQATIPNCPAAILQGPPKNATLFQSKKDENTKLVRISCKTEWNKKNKVQDFAFIPGMFASISIAEEKIPNVVVLPSTAISYSLYGNSVFLIEEKDKVLKARRVYIETGDSHGNEIIIKKGVQAGQTVVSTGELKLDNDVSVKINNSIILKDISDPDKLGQ